MAVNPLFRVNRLADEQMAVAEDLRVLRPADCDSQFGKRQLHQMLDELHGALVA